MDSVLDYLWRADLIDCRVTRSEGVDVDASRRVIEGRERRRGSRALSGNGDGAMSTPLELRPYFGRERLKNSAE